MENHLQTWTHTTTENSSHYVVDQPREIFTRTCEAVFVLDRDGASLLDANGTDWPQFSTLNLCAIQASFIRCLPAKTVGALLSYGR
jgi:hypothetical protein